MTHCPVCEKLHPEDDGSAGGEAQSLDILRCAEKLASKIKSIRDFRRKFETFIDFLDTRNIQAIEARAYLIEFDKIYTNITAANGGNKIRREYFGSEKVLADATRLKEKMLSKKARHGEIKRPKQMCPICYRFHFYSAEITDKCWARAMKGDISQALEFKKFLEDNNYGELTL